MKQLIIKYRNDENVQYARFANSFGFEVEIVNEEVYVLFSRVLNPNISDVVMEMVPELSLEPEISEHYEVLMNENPEFAQRVAYAYREEIEDAIDDYLHSDRITLNLNDVFEDVSKLIAEVTEGYWDDIESEIISHHHTDQEGDVCNDE